MTKIATLIRRLEGNWQGEARLYRCEPPMLYRKDWEDDEDSSSTDYVIVSASPAFGTPETYIFPADGDGNLTDWGELRGSFQGDLDHARALNEAGYEVA